MGEHVGISADKPRFSHHARGYGGATLRRPGSPVLSARARENTRATPFLWENRALLSRHSPHGVTLASPAPASGSSVAAVVSSEITVVSSTSVVSITAVDSLVNPVESAGADVSGGSEVGASVVSGVSVALEVSAGDDDGASVVGSGASDVVTSVDVVGLDVSTGAGEVGLGLGLAGVVGVGFTGGGVGVAVLLLWSLITTEASASSANALSQALVSFSHAAANATVLTKNNEPVTRGAPPSLQPGLRREMRCRGSFVFVIVSR